MPADVVRNLGPSTSQSSTGTAIGHAEDLEPVVLNIDPSMTILMNKFGRLKKAKELDWSWFLEHLEPPQENAWPEMMEYTFPDVGSLRMLRNYQQHLYKAGKITDAQNQSEKAYSQEDIAREKMNILTQIGRDTEFAIVKNTISRGESGNQVAMTGGVPFFMSKDEMECTVATTGIVTTTEDHKLKTGDFVYLQADTMPEGMDSEDVYYIRVLSDTTFQLYDSIEGAVKDIASEKVAPTSTGTNVKIVLNNVYDLGGEEDFTLDHVNHVLELAKRRGGNPTEAYMSTKKFSRFNNLVNALVTTNRKSGENKVDMVTTTYIGPNGIVNAHAHQMYSDKRIDFYDMQYWHLKYFSPIHWVTGLAKTGTYEKFAAEGWVGLQASQPLSSASLTGIKR